MIKYRVVVSLLFALCLPHLSGAVEDNRPPSSAAIHQTLERLWGERKFDALDEYVTRLGQEWFDVTLKANVLPADITADKLDEAWSKISGPASGSLNRTDTFEVKYQNPKQGGVYRFDFDLGGGVKSEANLVLPLAGAE